MFSLDKTQIITTLIKLIDNTTEKSINRAWRLMRSFCTAANSNLQRLIEEFRKVLGETGLIVSYLNFGQFYSIFSISLGTSADFYYATLLINHRTPANPLLKLSLGTLTLISNCCRVCLF